MTSTYLELTSVLVGNYHVDLSLTVLLVSDLLKDKKRLTSWRFFVLNHVPELISESKGKWVRSFADFTLKRTIVVGCSLIVFNLFVVHLCV